MCVLKALFIEKTSKFVQRCSSRLAANITPWQRASTAANKIQSSDNWYKRAKDRTEKCKYIEQLVQLLPNVLIDDLCEGEVKNVATEQISIGMRYTDVARAKEPTVWEWSRCSKSNYSKPGLQSRV